MEEMTEMIGPIVATEAVIAEQVVAGQAFAELDQRLRALEDALGGLRTVAVAASSGGRKTQVASASLLAKGADVSVDDALRSLSLEQRIAVKSGLMRAGLLS